MKVKAFISLTISKTVELEVQDKHTEVDLRIAALKQVELPADGWDRNEFDVIEE